MRVAVADLGSNTFQILSAESANGQLQNPQLETYPVLLRKRWEKTKNPQDVLQALYHIHQRLQALHPDRYKIVATAAWRQIPALHALLKQVFPEAEILSGQNEARWTWEGARRAVPELRDWLLVDIGGGSVEFILTSDGQIHDAWSIDAGTAVLDQTLGLSWPTLLDLWQAMQERLEETARRIPTGLPWVGTGGGWQALVNLVEGQWLFADDRLEPVRYSLPPGKIMQWLEIWQSYPPEVAVRLQPVASFRRWQLPYLMGFAHWAGHRLDMCELIATTYDLKVGLAFALTRP